MIKVFIQRLTPEGIEVSGEENGSILGLDSEEDICGVSQIEYRLNASLVNNGVLVTGAANVVLRCKCAKCLKEYDYNISNNELCRFYEKPNKSEIDLTDDIREDILIGLPQRFLCSNSCKGLCFSCGIDLNVGKCDCSNVSNKENIWQSLDQLNI